jgi:DNA-binding PadR family transcriptional regulator
MAVLGLLKEQDMHGYELKKRLSDVFGVSSAVSFGSLYPALARLEAAGAVHAVVEAEGSLPGGAGRPLAEGRADRRRKVFGITALGARVFEDLLADSQGGGEDERSFHLRLAFARYLPPASRLGLLEQRRAVLGERLVQMASRARARRDDRYLKILFERQREALSGDVSWLDHLIEEERVGGAATGLRPPILGAGRPPVHGQARLVPLASASQLQRPVPQVPNPPLTTHQQ